MSEGFAGGADFAAELLPMTAQLDATLIAKVRKKVNIYRHDTRRLLEAVVNTSTKRRRSPDYARLRNGGIEAITKGIEGVIRSRVGESAIEKIRDLVCVKMGYCKNMQRFRSIAPTEYKDVVFEFFVAIISVVISLFSELAGHISGLFFFLTNLWFKKLCQCDSAS
jgi:hypothetical protein